MDNKFGADNKETRHVGVQTNIREFAVLLFACRRDRAGGNGDRDYSYVKLAMRGSMEEPFTSPDFEACAERLYTAALKHLVEA